MDTGNASLTSLTRKKTINKEVAHLRIISKISLISEKLDF